MPALSQQQPPAAPAAPTAPQAPVAKVAGSPDVNVNVVDPTEAYRAIRSQRDVLREQLDNLESKRLSIAQRLREGRVTGADRAGLESRLTELDKQISNVDQQIAANERSLAQAAAVPGTSTEQPRNENYNNGPNEGEIAITAICITGVLLFPVFFAWARRLWKRGSAAVVSLPAEVLERFTRFEQAIDSVAIEVERVSEGQRWVTRLMTERAQSQDAGALGAGPAQPVEVRQGEKVPNAARG
ncbi:MAG: hypothetical protein JWO05_1590 [Gemmatimonadetes bacterium]|nr:hypothetical protein [Gemmatimonadota bacterium]